MRVQRCVLCTYYKKIKERYAYSFCTLANKRCLEVKRLECNDARLTVEMNRILKRICKITSEDIENAKEVSDLINKAIEDQYDKARAADTPKPGQTDPS